MRNLFALAAAGIVAAAPLPIPAGRAAAVEIHVMTAGAAQEAEKQLAAGYRRMTGNRISFVSGTVGQIQERLKSGEAADVVVISKPALDQLEDIGQIRTRSSAVLGRIGIGVGVKDGSRAPDIGTADKFKAAMLEARSISYMDPATGASSGIAAAKILRELGIAEQIAAKTRLTETGYSAERVASGEVELAIQNISEILPVKGVQLAGPLPYPLQVYTVFSAGVPSSSVNPKEAIDFIRFLIRKESASTWQEAGVEPAFQAVGP